MSHGVRDSLIGGGDRVHPEAARAQAWPLLGLRIRTARLELRLPTCEDITRLAPVSYHRQSAGRVGATFTASELLAREQARSISEWSTNRWYLTFGVFRGGDPVGIQSVTTERFPSTRSFETPAWVAPTMRRQGFATEMRVAVLCLMFDYLAARVAVASPFAGNIASIEVSKRLGYEQLQPLSGSHASKEPTTRLTLTTARWRTSHLRNVEIEGLGLCLPLFGLTAQTGDYPPE
jgi:RimJ/RimL family protein N-acetyltransferase